MVREALPELAFMGCYEYVVDAQIGDKITAHPKATTTGLPPIVARMRPPVGGIRCTVAPQSTVIVMFADSNPAKPFIAFTDPSMDPLIVDIPATVTVRLAGGTLPTAHMGDFAGPFPIAATAIKVLT